MNWQLAPSYHLSRFWFAPPANGFSATDPSWANLGQGAPETGPLPDSPPRIASIDFISLGGDEIHEYAPTSGLKSLREAVANYYNKEYREGMESQYTYENVCIVSICVCVSISVGVDVGVDVCGLKAAMSSSVGAGVSGQVYRISLVRRKKN